MEICSQEKIKEVVHVLKLLNKKFVEEDLKKKPLLEDTAESLIYLQVMLKKIPSPQLIRMIRVPLPHPLITETSEVCLITGDLEKQNHKAEIEPTILHYKDLLRKQGVTKVSEVIPLRQLRTEYKTFESKRQLAAAYDVFLADKKIAGVLPKTLGKSFFKDRKFPIQIDMKRPNLKDHIDKALSQTKFSLTCRGNSYALEVGRLSMEDVAVVENIKTSIEVLENKLPGQEKNILSLYIKTAKSKAIPMYVSLGISDDIIIKKPRKNEKFKLDELSTMDDAEVKVFRNGRVVLRKMKKESSNNENTSEDDKNLELNEPFSDELIEDEDTQASTADEVFLKKKKGKKSSDLIEIIDNDELENEENLQDLVANKSATRKKKSKKAAEVEKFMNNDEMKNEEANENFIANKVSKKNKNSQKDTFLDQVRAVSQDENKEIQDSFITENSSKKKKTIFSPVSDSVSENVETKTEEDIQNSPFTKASSKKKNKNNMDSSHLEEDRESSLILNSEQRKIWENKVNAKVLKFKNKRASKSKDNDEIEKVMKSEKRKSVFEIDVEDIIMEKTPTRKKAKATARIESSLLSGEDDEIKPNQKTHLKSKKARKENGDLAPDDSLILKGKKANVDNDVKTSSGLKKLLKSGRNSLSTPLKAKE